MHICICTYTMQHTTYHAALKIQFESKFKYFAAHDFFISLHVNEMNLTKGR